MNIETLPELRATYFSARRAMIERHRDMGKTQTQAAKDLGVSLSNLNNYIHRDGIPWAHKAQGRTKQRKD